MQQYQYSKPISASIQENVIYLGHRDDRFINLIKTLLRMAEIKPKYIDLLTDKDGMVIYSTVFTHKSADPVNNYEFYELLGDATLNKIIPWYIIKRFPQLKNPEFVAILARLKINLASKTTFSTIAQRIGMWEFISADTITRTSEMKPTLEDVLEAFFGATELMLEERGAKLLGLDEKILQGVAGVAMFRLGSKLFDEDDISLDYEKLVDAKTRLKELCDLKKDLGQNIKYVSDRVGLSVESRVLFANEVIGIGKASLKKDADQNAAQCALTNLLNRGIYRNPPPIYQKLKDITR
jgi:dsRNA-specific ribonuclease